MAINEIAKITVTYDKGNNPIVRYDRKRFNVIENHNNGKILILERNNKISFLDLINLVFYKDILKSKNKEIIVPNIDGEKKQVRRKIQNNNIKVEEKRIVFTSPDGKITLYDRDSGILLEDLKTPIYGNGIYLESVEDNTIKIFDSHYGCSLILKPIVLEYKDDMKPTNRKNEFEQKTYQRIIYKSDTTERYYAFNVKPEVTKERKTISEGTLIENKYTYPVILESELIELKSKREENLDTVFLPEKEGSEPRRLFIREDGRVLEINIGKNKFKAFNDESISKLVTTSNEIISLVELYRYLMEDFEKDETFVYSDGKSEEIITYEHYLKVAISKIMSLQEKSIKDDSDVREDLIAEVKKDFITKTLELKESDIEDIYYNNRSQELYVMLNNGSTKRYQVDKSFRHKMFKNTIRLLIKSLNNYSEVIEENGLYGLRNKETKEVIIPPIIKLRSDAELIINAIQVSEDRYKNDSLNGYIVKSLHSKDRYGFLEGDELDVNPEYKTWEIMVSDFGELKVLYYGERNPSYPREHISISMDEVLRYYTNKIKKNEGVNSDNFVRLLNEELESNQIPFKLNEETQTIINDRVFLLKNCFESEDTSPKYRIVDLDKEDSYIFLNKNVNDLYINGRIILLGFTNNNCATYDMKLKEFRYFDKIQSFSYISEDFLCDGNNAFYDLRNGFAISKADIQDEYSNYDKNSRSSFVKANGKLLYSVSNPDTGEVKNYVYDIEKGEVEAKEKLDEFEYINILPDFQNDFRIETKDGIPLAYHDPIEVITEFDKDFAELCGIDTSILGDEINSSLGERFYAINNADIFYVYIDQNNNARLYRLPEKSVVVEFSEGNEVVTGQTDLSIVNKVEGISKQKTLVRPYTLKEMES